MYIYDADGSHIGMQYLASSYAEGVFDYYFFEKNLQGDIVAVYGSNGTKYVEYSYDAWGNFTTTYYNSSASIGAAKNPFTYRGYYYDADLGLYYLNSRYYDQNTRRFVNVDSALYHSMFGYNMFVYCENNPIKYIDPTGEYALTATIGYGLLCLIGFGGLVHDAMNEQYLSEAFVDLIDAVDDFVDDIANLLEDNLEESSSPAPKADDPPQSVPKACDAKEVDDDANSLPNQGKVTAIPDATPVDAGQQGKHVIGHNNNKDPKKTTWLPGENGVRQTQEAWKNSRTVPDRPNIRIGKSADGRTIKIHFGKNGIHGYPIFL